MVGNNAKPIVLFNFRQIALAKILSERFITPKDFFLNVITTDEWSLYNPYTTMCRCGCIFLFSWQLLFASCTSGKG
jgi:hypothetical protein